METLRLRDGLRKRVARMISWARTPSWGRFWVLSALIPALLIFTTNAMPPAWWPWILLSFMGLSFSHSISPIVLAWTHRDFRALMLERPRKFIGVPVLAVMLGIVAALSTWVLFPNFVLPRHLLLENVQLDQLVVPIVAWANIYAVWNFYHFGMQNFGILSIQRGRSWGQWRTLVLVGAVTASVVVGYGAHWLGLKIFLLVFAITSINHWLVELGLTSHVDGRYHERSPLWFATVMLVTGSLLTWGYHVGAHASTHLVILLLALRASLGLWHFLQDRWLWTHQGRATLGVRI